MSTPRALSADATASLAGLGALLKAERARLGLSQRAAADEMGLSYATICRVENGQLPDVPNFLAIVAWLGVPLGTLLGGERAKTFDAYRRGWADCETVVLAALHAGRGDVAVPPADG